MNKKLYTPEKTWYYRLYQLIGRPMLRAVSLLWNAEKEQ